MLKLIKYEWKKQALTKAIFLVIVALSQLGFGIYLVLNDMDRAMVVIAISMMIMMMAIFFFALEGITTYSKDLKTKNSYMLFMVPHSTYTVIGAKLIIALLTVLLAGVVMFFIILADFTVLLVRFEGLSAVWDMIQELFKGFLNIDINMKDLFLVLITMLVSFFTLITTAFFAITLSRTLLENKRINGVISFVIFCAISYASTWITNKLFTVNIFNSVNLSDVVGSVIVSTVVMIACYFGTVLLLDKKISL